jgi:hypothetical protein
MTPLPGMWRFGWDGCAENIGNALAATRGINLMQEIQLEHGRRGAPRRTVTARSITTIAGRRPQKGTEMHRLKDDEAEPTAAERLAMEIVELREEINELRYRLDGSRPSPERAQRWKRTLAIVEAALAEKRQ